MISAVILAAGMSTRFGRPKQLLRFGDKTILEHVVERVMMADIGEIIVVVGAYRQEVEKILSNYDVRCVFNAGFRGGQGTSVAAGTAAVDEASAGILFVAADQPFLSSPFLNKMIAEFRKRNPLILKTPFGIPVIFSCGLRAELVTLSGDVGGRQLIKKYRDKVEVLPGCPWPMTLDIDTERDYEVARELWQAHFSAGVQTTLQEDIFDLRCNPGIKSDPI